MEKRVQFKKITNTRSGVSKAGNNWESVEFLTEFHNGKLQKLVLFKTMQGEEVKKLNEGDTINVTFEVESREYNEKYYTDAVAYKVELVEAAKVKTPSSQGKVTLTENLSVKTDETLPF